MRNEELGMGKADQSCAPTRSVARDKTQAQARR